MARIDSFKYGEIKIDGKVYYSDMVVYWDGKKEFREKSHMISIEEADAMLKRKPQMIVIGTGIKNKSIKVPEKTRYLIEQNNVMLFVDKTPNAVEIFNAFTALKKKAVAVIHTSL